VLEHPFHFYSFVSRNFLFASFYVFAFAHNPLCTDSSWRNMQFLKNVNMTHCLTCSSCSLYKSRPDYDTLAFRRRLCAARKLGAFSLAPLCTRPFCCPFSYNAKNIDGYIYGYNKIQEISIKEFFKARYCCLYRRKL